MGLYDMEYMPGPLRQVDSSGLKWMLRKARSAKLFGFDEARYPKPFGNASIRLEGSGKIRFLISGKRGGRFPIEDDYLCLVEYDTAREVFASQGPIEPATEYLLHGTVYRLSPARAVLHSHSPEIWSAAGRLGMPCTGERIANKTPEMVKSIERLFQETDVRERGIFALPGHRDGVVAFGESPEKAWDITSSYLEKAKGKA